MNVKINPVYSVEISNYRLKYQDDTKCKIVSNPGVCDHFWRMVKMRFGTDELGIDEIGTGGVVKMRLVKLRCAG